MHSKCKIYLQQVKRFLRLTMYKKKKKVIIMLEVVLYKYLLFVVQKI